MAESVGYLDSILQQMYPALMQDLSGAGIRTPFDPRDPRGGMPSTMASTGNVQTPIFRPPQTQPIPPGAVPSMGLGESAYDVPAPSAPAAAPPIAASAAPPAAPDGLSAVNPALYWRPPASSPPGMLDPVLPPTAPADAALPPTAAPAAGVAPPTMPVPPPPPAASEPPAVPAASLAGRVSSMPGYNRGILGAFLPEPPAGSVFDKISRAINDNSNALIGIGGGLAGGRTLGESVAGASSGLLKGREADRQLQNQNFTAAFLAQRVPGLSHEQALGMAASPEILKQILPAVVGSKELGNANGVLYDKATGRVVADLSEGQKWQIGKVQNPKTGEDVSVLVQPATGKVRAINPTDLTRTSGQGGAASENISIPPQARLLPPAEQYRQAPDGSTATLGGRPVVKRNGRWEYQ